METKYSKFDFTGYSVTSNDSGVKIEFVYQVLGLTNFKHVIQLPAAFKNFDFQNNQQILLVIGLFEMLSYWKAVVSTELTLPLALQPLDEWARQFIRDGLGQFYYENDLNAEKISAELKIDYVAADISVETSLLESATEVEKTLHGSVIMVGGGKDSILAMELLKEDMSNNLAFVVQTNANSVQAAIDTATTAGFGPQQIIKIQRTIDPQLIDLNRQGFYNGHVPISATFGALAALTALAFGKRYVVAANESSANESTVKGSKVNHQYSKTYEFEQMLHTLLQKYVNGKVYYYSILRPYNELQIASKISKLDKYFSSFISCNLGGKKGEWCGNCSKCLFTFIIFSPFLSQEELVGIFGSNVLDNQALLDDFEKLIGIQDVKPFECVGTVEEVNAAISLGVKNFGANLPYLYRVYLDKFAAQRPEITLSHTLVTDFFDAENLIPDDHIQYVAK